MAWTMTPTDVADASGASVVVSGTGSAYKVQRAPVTVTGTGSYVDKVGPTSSGGTTVVAGLGYWMWQLIDSGSSAVLDGPDYVPATAEGDSVWDRCLVMVADRLAAIGIPWIDADRIFTKVMPTDIDLSVGPAVLVTATNLTAEVVNQTNKRDDVVYPVTIVVDEATPNDLNAHRQRFLKAAHQIDRAFSNQSWDARVPEVWIVNSIPGTTFDGQTIHDNRERYSLNTIKCKAREIRGII